MKGTHECNSLYKKKREPLCCKGEAATTMATRLVSLVVVSCLVLSLFLFKGATAEDQHQHRKMALSYYSSIGDIADNCIEVDDQGEGPVEDSVTIPVVYSEFHLRFRQDLLITVNALVTTLIIDNTTTSANRYYPFQASPSSPTHNPTSTPSTANRGWVGGYSAAFTVTAALFGLELCLLDEIPSSRTCVPYAPADSFDQIPRACHKHNAETEEEGNCWIGPTELQPFTVNAVGYEEGGASLVTLDAMLVSGSLTMFARNIPRGSWALTLVASKDSFSVVDAARSVYAICLGQAVMTVQPTHFVVDDDDPLHS